MGTSKRIKKNNRKQKTVERTVIVNDEILIITRFKALFVNTIYTVM